MSHSQNSHHGSGVNICPCPFSLLLLLKVWFFSSWIIQQWRIQGAVRSFGGTFPQPVKNVARADGHWTI